MTSSMGVEEAIVLMDALGRSRLEVRRSSDMDGTKQMFIKQVAREAICVSGLPKFIRYGQYQSEKKAP